MTKEALKKMSVARRAKKFLAFVKSKPANEQFVFMDTTNCALGQFAQSLGIDAKGGTHEIYVNNQERIERIEIIPSSEDKILFIGRYYTFGELSIALAKYLDGWSKVDRKEKL